MVASKTHYSLSPTLSRVTPKRIQSRTISKSNSPSPSPLRRSPRNHCHKPDSNSDLDDHDTLPDSQDSQQPKSQRRLVSWIWNHGFLTEHEEFWRCARCSEPIVEFKICATTHAGSHLRKVHNIHIREQGSKAHAKKAGDTIGQIGTFFKRPPQPFEADRFKSYLIEWVLQHRISFRQI